MEGYQTEEQQLKVILGYWQKNRVFVVLLVIVFFGILFGTHMYRNYTIKQAEQASDLYQDMLLAVQQTEVKTAKDKGALLLKHYKRTPYAVLGSMVLAKISIDEKNLPAAIDKLRYVIKKSGKTPLWYIAKVKLARLLYNTKEYQEALKELDPTPKEYASLYEELKGDIYVSLNDLDKARDAYKKAIESSKGNPVPWLEMKLTNVNTVEDALKKGAIDAAITTHS